jgi:lipopolysaccharide transport system ATP-binding protein
VHALVPGAVAFQVDDHFGGDSARGDYMGDFPGVIRPIVEWSTDVVVADEPESGIALTAGSALLPRR